MEVGDATDRWGNMGHPTYHVNVIKLIWEIMWTAGLPHLPGVPHLHVKRPYKSTNRYNLQVNWAWPALELTNFIRSWKVSYWFKCTKLRAFTNANLNDSSLSYKNNLTLVSLNFSFKISGLLFGEISERRQTRNWSGFHSSSTSRTTQPPTLIRHFLNLGCKKIQWRTITQYPSIISGHERFPLTT